MSRILSSSILPSFCAIDATPSPSYARCVLRWSGPRSPGSRGARGWCAGRIPRVFIIDICVSRALVWWRHSLHQDSRFTRMFRNTLYSDSNFSTDLRSTAIYISSSRQKCKFRVEGKFRFLLEGSDNCEKNISRCDLDNIIYDEVWKYKSTNKVDWHNIIWLQMIPS